MPLDLFFDAAILLVLGFVLFVLSTFGGNVMSATQAAVDAVVAQLDKVRAEVVGARDVLLARIEEVQSQLDDGVEVVDLTALKAAAQSLDDIVPDPVVEVPVGAPDAVEAPSE